MFELVNGFKKCMYWSKAKMEAHADKYSQAFSKDAVSTTKFKKVSFADFEAGKYPKEDEWKYSSFWYKDFDGMAFKTMLRQLISKWGIMSIEMQNAFANDNTYKETLDPEEAPKYEDNDDAIDVDANEATGEWKEEPKQQNNDSLLGDLA
jgi:recombination protein RecT